MNKLLNYHTTYANLTRFMPINKVAKFMDLLHESQGAIVGALVNNIMRETIYDGRYLIIYSPQGITNMDNLLNNIYPGARRFSYIDMYQEHKFTGGKLQHKAVAYNGRVIIVMTVYNTDNKPVSLRDYLTSFKWTIYANYFDGRAAHCYYPHNFKDNFTWFFDKLFYYWPIDIYEEGHLPDLKKQYVINPDNFVKIKNKANDNHKLLMPSSNDVLAELSEFNYYPGADYVYAADDRFNKPVFRCGGYKYKKYKKAFSMDIETN